MALLNAIWISSAVLAAASVAGMSILIVRRVFSDAAAARGEKRRNELEGLFIRALDGTTEWGGLALSDSDRMMLASIAFDLSKSIRGGTLQTMEHVLSGIGVEDALLEALSNPDPRVRRSAINGLSLFDTRRSFDAVWQLLSDPNADIRLLAARVIVSSSFKFDAKVFCETLELGTAVRSREVRPIVAALAERDPDGVLRTIRASRNPDARVMLIYGLGRSGKYGMVDDLADLLSSPNVNERAESLRALSVLQHPAAADAVRQALTDPAWEVRAQAAQAAADIGMTDVAPALERMLDDEMWWVRYRAAESLWLLGEQGQRLLLAHSAGSDPAGLVAQLVIAERTEAAA
ncbi:MAG: HEAT repeat domain-containing protein [Rhodospirillales bacterium]